MAVWGGWANEGIDIAWRRIMQYKAGKMREMSEEEIMSLTTNDFRDLTAQEQQQDNFRRMFQLLGIIYNNQVEIKNMLTADKNP